MFISVDSTNKNFLIREINNTDRARIRRESFKASIYMKSSDNTKDGIAFKSGLPLKRYLFDSNADYWDFKKRMESRGLYGDIQPIYQYLHEYKNDINDIKNIQTWIIDIEVYARGEFPTPSKANKFPIVAITLNNRNKYYSFVYDMHGRFSLKSTDEWEIFVFKTEIEMLNAFIDFWVKHIPRIHILTGWNSESYDLPYIINRLLHVFESDEYINALSPFKIIEEKKGFAGKITHRIVGIPHLDYLELFKKFNFSPRSSYALESICQEELKYGKVDHSEYGTFADFYDNNINLYIEYNKHDVKLIKELDDKHKYINLAMTIAEKCKINFENVFSPIRCWEALVYNKLLNDNIILPPRSDRPKESYMGAFVQEPKEGLIKDIISYDLTSLYPSTIRAINCSPEMLLESEIDDNATIDSFINGYVPKIYHDRGCIVDAAGHIYLREKEGIIPQLMRELFVERKENQKVARDIGKEIQELKKEIEKLELEAQYV